MRLLKFNGLGFFILLLVACTAVDASRNTTLEQDVTSLMKTVCTETGTPGVSVYIKSPKYGDHSLVWGAADLVTQTPVAKGQLFRIGSLTKSFTAAAILKLAGRGLLDLDAPISSYLGLVNGYAPLAKISVRQLMNMNSGLAQYLTVPFLAGTVLPNPEQGYRPDELLAVSFHSAPELLFPPGSDFLYTNTNYILLGMLIEAVSGRSYQDYIQETFITPMGLKDTHVVVDGTIPAGLVQGYYDFDEDGSYENWTKMNMSYVWSAGCIVSTARDVAVWMDALAKGELVAKEFWPDLYQGQATVEGMAYGAGILINGNLVGHNGTVIGYHADAWHDSQTDTTVAVLSNTNAPLLADDRDPTREIAEGILALMKE